MRRGASGRLGLLPAVLAGGVALGAGALAAVVVAAALGDAVLEGAALAGGSLAGGSLVATGAVAGGRAAALGLVTAGIGAGAVAVSTAVRFIQISATSASTPRASSTSTGSGTPLLRGCERGSTGTPTPGTVPAAAIGSGVASGAAPSGDVEPRLGICIGGGGALGGRELPGYTTTVVFGRSDGVSA